MLLRPRDKGSAPPLPRVAFALTGAALGAWYLSTWLSYWLERGMEYLPPNFATELHPHSVAIAIGMLIAAGGIAGWIVGGPLNRILGWSFRTFNAGFGVATNVYTRMVGMLLRVSIIVLLVYGGLVALTYFGFVHTPKGFIPVQDKGYLLVNVQLPDSASAHAHARRGEADRGHRPPGSRRRAHRRHRRPIDPAQRQRAELRRHVRDAERFP